MMFAEDMLRRAQIQSKLSEVGLVCAVDTCRMASRVRPDGDVALRMLAFDIAPELKVSRHLDLSFAAHSDS